MAAVKFEAASDTSDWVLRRLRPYLDAIEVISDCNSAFEGWTVLAPSSSGLLTHDFKKFERICPSGEKCTFFVASARRVVVVSHPDIMWRRIYALRMIRNALRWEMLRFGALFLHGCCLSHHGRGLCILGPRMSGKSFLCYSLLRQGHWEFITQDDVCLLKDRDNGWHLLGWPGCLRLRLSALDIFGELRNRPDAFEHPANRLEQQLPSDVGMLRIFPEELQRDFGAPIRSECIPKVIVVLTAELEDTAFRPINLETLISIVLQSWDVLPERRPGASSLDALHGRRKWQDVVFDPFFLESFGLPQIENLQAKLAAFCTSVTAFAAGREAMLHKEFGDIVRSHLTR